MKCTTKYCRNERAPQRTICYKCYSRRVRDNNPICYTFNALRNNARRRGKEFTLSFEEFKRFCAETGYLQSKGKGKNDMTIDRRDNLKGYSIDNIRIMTLSANRKKGTNNECPF